MNILLVNPTASYLFPLAKDMSEFPSLGLGYLASPLIKNGHKVLYLDAINQHSFGRELKKIRPEIVVIGDLYFRTYFAFMFPVMKEIAKNIKKIYPECFVILTGAFASNYPDKILKNTFINGVICGEGEETLLEIVAALEKEGNLELIKGFLFRDNGKIRGIRYHRLVENLDGLPFPSQEIYSYKNVKGSKGRYLAPNFSQMITSRGCPFACSFCITHTMYGKNVRRRSLDNVIEEISILKSERGIKYIIFWDDTFTLNRQFVVDFCKEVNKMKIKWSCNTRVDCVDEVVLKLMKDSGCDSILYGVECAQKDILSKISLTKGSNNFFSSTQKAFYLTNKIGIKSVASLIAGLPDDTVDHIYQDFEYAKRLNPRRIYIRPALAIPGTKFYYELVVSNIIPSWEFWDWKELSTPPYGYPTICKNVSRIKLQNIIYEIKTLYPTYFK